MKSIYVVCYDISNDRVRTKIEKVLSGYGMRVQFSVFECILTAMEKEELVRELKKIFNNPKVNVVVDSICIYRICEACKAKTERIGANNSLREDYVIV